MFSILLKVVVVVEFDKYIQLKTHRIEGEREQHKRITHHAKIPSSCACFCNKGGESVNHPC